MVLFPTAWIAAFPASLLYMGWAASNSKFHLPFRMAKSWGGIDYNMRHPAEESKFLEADAILCLGISRSSREELWITNDDARRHGFILGTTGSGKALTHDTLVLTPKGYMRLGDLLPGDRIMHPKGGTTEVVSVHPQGEVEKLEIVFEDGRRLPCSPDHLWEVEIEEVGFVKGEDGAVVRDENGKALTERLRSFRPMTARDLAILIGVRGDGIRIRTPLIERLDQDPLGDHVANLDAWLGGGGVSPSTVGSHEQRLDVLRRLVARGAVRKDPGGLRVCGLAPREASELKAVARSVGGRAATWITSGRMSRLRERARSALGAPLRSSVREGRARGKDVVMTFPGIDGMFPGAEPFNGLGPRILSVEATGTSAEMSCIRTCRDDGLFVIEDHVVTHNTELLLGLVSQAIMWSSGFMFIDGKGTAEFYTRAWELAKRFGREDDVRVLNFTDGGGDPEAPAGGPAFQSNTANPLTKGDSEQLMNILVSIMGEGGKGNDMWKDRATAMVTANMKCMVEMRDRGELPLDVSILRRYMALGRGFDTNLLGGKKITRLEDVPERAWEEMRTRTGMIEIFLRAKRGEFSAASEDAILSFFDSLPSFNEELALQGKAQIDKCNEQFNYLYMQLTKPLSTFADSYRHIFMTPFGEVDMADVMLNRRILIVLLPALQKAKSEMQNCGKVVVSLVKIMMGNASGAKLDGDRSDVEASPTRSISPYIVVLDEVGYYMVDGIDVMMAQARSLGFMIILAGQDMAAMQAVSKEISEITAANASVFAAGKCVDGGRTLEFIQKVIGKMEVSVYSGYQIRRGTFTDTPIVKDEISLKEIDRVSLKELQALRPGEFFYLFEGEVILANTFYVGGIQRKNDRFTVNKFVRISSPMTNIPGLDQTQEHRFISEYTSSIISAMDGFRNGDLIDASEPPRDSLNVVAEAARAMTAAPGRAATLRCWSAAVAGLRAGSAEEQPGDVSIYGIDEPDVDDLGEYADDAPRHDPLARAGRRAIAAPGDDAPPPFFPDPRVPEYADFPAGGQDDYGATRRGPRGRRDDAMSEDRKVLDEMLKQRRLAEAAARA
ncbi:MAG: hypothetical protein DI629_17630, partial [Mesorhizobium amorphae]